MRKIIILLLFIKISQLIFGQSIFHRTSNDNKIVLLDSTIDARDYQRILFLSDLDSSKFIFDSIRIRYQQLSLSPSREYAAITTFDTLNHKPARIDFYNRYRKLIKSNYVDIGQRIKISNDLRFINEGPFESSYATTTKVFFYNSNGILNKNTPKNKFGQIHESLFTNSSFFYHLTLFDTMYCYKDCDLFLLIFNSNFKLISKHVFLKVNPFSIYDLKEESNDLVSLIHDKNGIKVKYYLNKKGKIIKEINEK